MAWRSEPERYQEFIDRFDLSFPQVEDSVGDVFTRFGVASQPGFAIVYPDGSVETLMGAADGALLDSIIQQAVDA